MRLALQLAKKGCGWTSPNPMVGAVVANEGRIIGQGWHQRYGQAHAERHALASYTEEPQGATLYVTLEPCCHYGKMCIRDGHLCVVIVEDFNADDAGCALDVERRWKLFLFQLYGRNAMNVRTAMQMLD